MLKFYKFLASFMFLSLSVISAAGPLGIIGGQSSAPYVALVEQDGSLRTLSGLPPTGLTYRVAINRSGESLIGGTSSLDAYAAFVSPNGSLTPIQGLIAPGEIYTVAINASGKGIIGGGYLLSSIPYAAYAFQNGTATAFSGLPSSGLIYSVDIDKSGDGIIGGVGNSSSAYAALVSSNGTLTPLSGLPTTGGIYWVSTNNSMERFIGGQDGASVYAAFVSPSGTLTPLAGLPLGLNYSVAINANGYAIMGGTSPNLPYAALVAQNGSVKTLKGLPTTAGKIYNVTINNSGTGLIAGFSTVGPYGSFVAPNGALTPLIGLPTGNGFLDGIALHSSGVALVGGEIDGTPFAAFAAPNGTLTYLSGLPADGSINTIALSSLDNLVPRSIGPFDSFANTQFTLSNTLTQHAMIHHKFYDECHCEPSSLWVSFFGNIIHEKARHAVPSFSNKIAGALVGLDYKKLEDLVLGAGIAYAYNHVHYERNLGHTEINQESLVLYASLNKPYFFMNAALWGGAFQGSNKRSSFSFIYSKANFFGWNLSPHLEICGPFVCQQVGIEPFVAFDWAFNWQNHYRERGVSGFNIVLNEQYASIFRSEAGIRFYETIYSNFCEWILEEKLSYVNRTPIHEGHGTAYFIGANSSFNVETLNRCSQNNGVIQVHIECIPYNLYNLYASIDYQGEFGSQFQSNMLALTLGKNF